MSRQLRSIVFCFLFFIANYGVLGADIAFVPGRTYGYGFYTETGGGVDIVMILTFIAYLGHQGLQKVAFGRRESLFNDNRGSLLPVEIFILALVVGINFIIAG